MLWESWEAYKGVRIQAAQKKFIEVAEPLLVERGIDIRDPKEPGPNYYNGCYVEEETVDSNNKTITTKKL